MGFSAFRLGDVRGIYPAEVNEQFAFQFAQAFVEHFSIHGNVATGRDMRTSSASLLQSLNDGLLEAGINVFDLGLCATELCSYATTRETVDAAIIVTASHNAPAFNGFKCILKSGRAVTYETGLSAIEKLMQQKFRTTGREKGRADKFELGETYIQFLASNFCRGRKSTGLIALNGLNGTATTLAARLAEVCDIDVAWYRQEPGPIPLQGADPALPSLAADMKAFMTQQNFELGVAWDADCDRCVFFDHMGNLIPAYYMVGLLAEHILHVNPGRAIVYDTKLCWNTLDVIERNHGIAVRSKTGHAFMKQKMCQSEAVYGGELSSHHYFADFFYCDSGMMAWLKVLELIQGSQFSLSELVEVRRSKYLCTPEISLKLTEVDRAFDEILSHYGLLASHVDEFDGLSFEMPGDWRFSLRRSKTEALVRLNLESKYSGESIVNEGAALLDRLLPFQAEDSDWHSHLVLQ